MKEGNKQTYNDAEWWCLLLNEVMSWLECALCCVFLCCLVVNCQFGCLSSLRGWTSVTFWASGPLTASSLQNLTGSLGSLLAPHYKWPCVAPGFARRVCLCDSILISCPFSAVRTKEAGRWSDQWRSSWVALASGATAKQSWRGEVKMSQTCNAVTVRNFCVVCAPTMYFVLTSFVCTSAFVTRQLRSGLHLMRQWLMW